MHPHELRVLDPHGNPPHDAACVTRAEHVEIAGANYRRRGLCPALGAASARLLACPPPYAPRQRTAAKGLSDKESTDLTDTSRAFRELYFILR
jgi:hypothetical protein